MSQSWQAPRVEAATSTDGNRCNPAARGVQASGGNGSIPADHDVGLGGQVKVDYLFTNVRNTQLFERQCRVNRMDRHQHAGS